MTRSDVTGKPRPKSSCRWGICSREAQFDFGEAKVVYRGREIKAMSRVMSAPHSDAFFCQAFPRECTETFQEGHVRAFEFFRGVPNRISYDNSRIAAAKIGGIYVELPDEDSNLGQSG